MAQSQEAARTQVEGIPHFERFKELIESRARRDRRLAEEALADPTQATVV